MTNSWMNADGEPIMDGAAWRFEQQLDMESAQERMYDDFYDNEPADYYDECPNCEGEYSLNTLTGKCEDCEYGNDYLDDESFVMEDQWLDGSYEE